MEPVDRARCSPWPLYIGRPVAATKDGILVQSGGEKRFIRWDDRLTWAIRARVDQYADEVVVTKPIPNDQVSIRAWRRANRQGKGRTNGRERTTHRQ